MLIAVLKAFNHWWRKRQRAIDKELLWPAFAREAKSLDHAKAGFAFHVFNDPAWTTDFSEAELIAYIEGLEAA